MIRKKVDVWFELHSVAMQFTDGKGMLRTNREMTRVSSEYKQLAQRFDTARGFEKAKDLTWVRFHL